MADTWNIWCTSTWVNEKDAQRMTFGSQQTSVGSVTVYIKLQNVHQIWSGELPAFLYHRIHKLGNLNSSFFKLSFHSYAFIYASNTEMSNEHACAYDNHVLKKSTKYNVEQKNKI